MYLKTEDALRPRLLNALDAMIELHGASAGHLQLWDPERQALFLAVQSGFTDQAAAEAAAPPVLQVIDTREPLVIEDLAADGAEPPNWVSDWAAHREPLRRAGIRALLAVPLLAPADEPLGVVTTCFRTPYRPAEPELQLTLRLARQAGDVIALAAQAEEGKWKPYSRLRTVLEGIPQLIWRASARGRWVWASPQWKAMTGLSAAASRGLGWLEALHPEDREKAMETWAAAETAPRLEVDLRIRDIAGGGYRWFQTRAAPLRGADGRITEWLGTCTDIEDRVRARAVLARSHEELEAAVDARTEALRQALDALHAEVQQREKAEESLRQSQKMEAVGQLTGGIAHDFNNMLQGISSSLELVQRRLDQQRLPEATRFLETARQTAGRAASLTQRLLAFARKQTLNARPIDLDTVARGIEDLIRRTVGPRIRVELQLHAGGWQVLCDENQMENALLNLAINARDAMPDGGELTIRTDQVLLTAEDLAGEEETAPGPYGMIEVSDTGTGMTPEVMARAFDPFFTTKTAGQGTGLGLSQIYGFLRQSKGLARIESAEGKGTTIRLYMPRHADASPPPAAPGTTPSAATVLLVEDEPELRAIVANWLREQGYQVLEAGDGPEALRLLRDAAPADLLLTDIRLPGGMNGREIAEAARARNPALPVLFVTGYAGSEFAAGAPSGPGTQLLNKPFALETLTTRIAAMLAPSQRPPG